MSDPRLTANAPATLLTKCLPGRDERRLGPSRGSNYGFGTIFAITPEGAFRTIYNFGPPGGVNSDTGLLQAANGALYGTTYYGGYNNFGTLFAMTPGGKLATLHSFHGADGEYPYAGLVQATNGALYGTTWAGGANNGGTIFGITPEGALTTLWSFDVDALPQGPLLQGTDGNLYGTTQADGTHGAGTVFRLDVALGPFIKTLPDAGPVGTEVKILGSDLRGLAAVTFNGTPAQVAPTEVVTFVPPGATTGEVVLTMGRATLVSNVPFRVTQ